MEFVRRLTEQDVTPGTFDTAFSTLELQAAQLIPVTVIKKGVHTMEEKKECCCHKKKERTEKEYKDLLNRLSRIEGQVRGIKRMVEEDAYCTDILIQVSAVNAALNSFNKALLANHIRTCVAEDIRAGKEETIDELVATLQKLMK